MSKKPMAFPILPSSSTPSTNADEDDHIQVLVPDKRRVLSDIKAIVDYQDTQIQMAQRELQQAQNQLAVERNRVLEFEAENEELKEKLDKIEESVITMQQEKSEHETQMYLLKSQVQSLQNQLREGQKQTNSLLSITRGHAGHVRMFLKNFNQTEKDLITLFPGFESSSASVSASSSTSSPSGEMPTSSSVHISEISLPVSPLTISHRHKHKHKRLKTKSTAGHSKIKKGNNGKTTSKERTNVQEADAAGTSCSTPDPDLEVVEESQEYRTLIQIEKDIESAFHLSDYQKILRLSTTGARLTEDNSMFRILKVHALTNLGRVQDAQEESAKILQVENIMDEMNAFALCTMAYCFYQSDQLDTCIEYYSQALIKEPDNQTAATYLPKIKAINELRATAKGTGKEALEVHKKSLQLLKGLDSRGNRVLESKLLFFCSVTSSDDRNAALEFVNQAITISPKFAKAVFQRAKLYVLDKKYSEALKDYQDCMRLDPKLPGLQALIDACQRATVQERPAQATPAILSPAQESDQSSPEVTATTSTSTIRRKSSTSANESGDETAKRLRN